MPRVSEPRRTGMDVPAGSPATTPAARPPHRWARVPPSRSYFHPRWLIEAGRSALWTDSAADRLLTAEIKERLKARYDAHGVILTDSGTSALTLALSLALTAQRANRVAVPAYTCFSVATAVAGSRGDAFLYDLEPKTFSPLAESVEEVLRQGVQVVVACPLYGCPVDVPGLMEQAARYGALVVEDAAQGAGATFAGRASGTFAPLSVVSFGRGKGLSCGGGGALLVRDSSFLRAARAVSRRLLPPNSGWKEVTRAMGEWGFGRPGLYRIPASLPALGLGETRYDPPTPPRAIARGAAALLRHALEDDLGTEEEDRRERAGRMRERLASVPGVELIRPVSGSVPGDLRLPFLAPGRRAAPQLGLMPGYPSTLGEIADFRAHLAVNRLPLPGAAELVRSLLTAPTHPWVPEDLGPQVERWLRMEGSAEGTRDEMASPDAPARTGTYR